mmetsp:Transcript_14204/g.43589  ORF Transcript_14204/g.43589 Transcript_14204/m.43589 type:complete len:253 (+) Transcript_14204:74-832(+)
MAKVGNVKAPHNAGILLCSYQQHMSVAVFRWHSKLKEMDLSTTRCVHKEVRVSLLVTKRRKSAARSVPYIFQEFDGAPDLGHHGNSSSSLRFPSLVSPSVDSLAPSRPHCTCSTLSRLDGPVQDPFFFASRTSLMSLRISSASSLSFARCVFISSSNSSGVNSRLHGLMVGTSLVRSTANLTIENETLSPIITAPSPFGEVTFQVVTVPTMRSVDEPSTAPAPSSDPIAAFTSSSCGIASGSAIERENSSPS